MRKKTFGFNVFLGIFILLMVGVPGFSHVLANRGEYIFDENGNPTVASSSIGQSIVEGGSYFLSSYSDVVMLLNKVELSELTGLDFGETQKILASAVNSLENARQVYIGLKQKVEGTPYKSGMRNRLASFDYQGFEQTHQLNASIFKELTADLSQGNARNIFAKLFFAMEDLLAQLYQIKAGVDNFKSPSIPALWRLNQKYSKTLLLGQYAAQVFCELANSGDNGGI